MSCTSRKQLFDQNSGWYSPHGNRQVACVSWAGREARKIWARGGILCAFLCVALWPSDVSMECSRLQFPSLRSLLPRPGTSSATSLTLTIFCSLLSLSCLAVAAPLRECFVPFSVLPYWLRVPSLWASVAPNFCFFSHPFRCSIIIVLQSSD